MKQITYYATTKNRNFIIRKFHVQAENGWDKDWLIWIKEMKDYCNKKNINLS